MFVLHLVAIAALLFGAANAASRPQPLHIWVNHDDPYSVGDEVKFGLARYLVIAIEVDHRNQEHYRLLGPFTNYNSAKAPAGHLSLAEGTILCKELRIAHNDVQSRTGNSFPYIAAVANHIFLAEALQRLADTEPNLTSTADTHFLKARKELAEGRLNPHDHSKEALKSANYAFRARVYLWDASELQKKIDIKKYTHNPGPESKPEISELIAQRSETLNTALQYSKVSLLLY